MEFRFFRLHIADFSPKKCPAISNGVAAKNLLEVIPLFLPIEASSSKKFSVELKKGILGFNPFLGFNHEVFVFYLLAAPGCS